MYEVAFLQDLLRNAVAQEVYSHSAPNAFLTAKNHHGARLLRYCLLVVVRKIISMGTIIAIPAAKPTKPTDRGPMAHDPTRSTGTLRLASSFLRCANFSKKEKVNISSSVGNYSRTSAPGSAGL
uniref:Uncharacterized protein n=1 Tax=Anopheles coluzzii TaxID=1518534 RepID=A0A8W7PMP2_ANOCL